MNIVEYIAHSIVETQALGLSIAKKFKYPMAILLNGNLGAGKTALSQAIITGLGITENVTSPTFSLMNSYRINGNNIYHFDLYRLEDVQELDGIGFYEYSKEGLSIIEWADKFIDEMPRKNIIINIEKLGDCERKITLMSKYYDKTYLEDLINVSSD